MCSQISDAVYTSSIVRTQADCLVSSHLADLKASGISEADALRHGMRSLTNGVEIGTLLNWGKLQGVSRLGTSLHLPYFDIHGIKTTYCRIKPGNPPAAKDGKPKKYLGPCKIPLGIYFPRIGAEKYLDPAIDLLFTEGEKKALCATLFGFPTIGLGGVAGWSVKREKDANEKPIGPRQLRQELTNLPWSKRRVYIAFDSDRATNPNVIREERLLAHALQALGAIVRIIEIPHNGIHEKQGLDDYLVRHGYEPFKQLIEKAFITPKSSGPPIPVFSNFELRWYQDQKGKDQCQRVGQPVERLVKKLCTLAGGFPKRVGKLPFARQGDSIHYLEKSDQLASWIGHAIYAQNPAVEANPVVWGTAQDMPTWGQFYASIQQQAESFDAVALYPHEPPLPRHYYCHPALRGTETKALFELLGRFAPASEIDADLLLAFFLTLVCGVPPGQRPAFLITASDDDARQGRGVGKTTLVRMASILFGGLLEYDKDETVNALKTRILSPAARGLRVILFDNIKTHRFSLSSLEALITSATISGKQNYVGEGQLPNTFTWCLTINGANLSKDMAQRCVIIKLARPKYDGNWESQTRQFIEDHRWDIIGGMVSMLRRTTQELTAYTRWGEWERLVLAKLENAQECMETILERQGAIDVDEEEKELVRQGFAQWLRDRGVNPVTEVAFLSSKQMAEELFNITGEKRATNRASSFLATLGVPELTKSDRGTTRGWFWRGLQSPSDSLAIQVR